MKKLKRFTLYASIAFAYGTLKHNCFYTWGFWVALILLMLWYIFDVMEEHIDD